MSPALKPLDLVVANKMHDAYGRYRQYVQTMAQLAGDRAPGLNLTDPHFAEAVARDLLCTISHTCPIETVFAALAAIKAPHSLADIADGLQAVKDRVG